MGVCPGRQLLEMKPIETLCCREREIAIHPEPLARTEIAKTGELREDKGGAADSLKADAWQKKNEFELVAERRTSVFTHRKFYKVNSSSCSCTLPTSALKCLATVSPQKKAYLPRLRHPRHPVSTDSAANIQAKVGDSGLALFASSSTAGFPSASYRARGDGDLDVQMGSRGLVVIMQRLVCNRQRDKCPHSLSR
jgi:hypothetical protein